MQLNALVPMLNVSDIHRSLQFYRDIAGFEVVSPPEKIEEWKWATIQSGNTTLMLSESGGPPKSLTGGEKCEDSVWSSLYYFYPDDVEALYERVKSFKYSVSELSIQFYGMKEFTLVDPDGHRLSFGEEVEESLCA